MISDLFSLPNLAKGVAKLYSGLGYFHPWGMKSPKGALLSHTVKSLGLRMPRLGKSMSQTFSRTGSLQVCAPASSARWFGAPRCLKRVPVFLGRHDHIQ